MPPFMPPFMPRPLSRTSRLNHLCIALCIAAAAALAGCGTTPVGQPAATVRPGGNDYSQAGNWLCRPGRDDACAAGLTAATVRPGGDSSRETWRPDPNAAIDCFYVYPTISMDQSPNSDMEAGPEERRAAQHQLARFGSECRLYAPVYRQVTVPALRSRLLGTPMQSDPQRAYDDVLDAWNHYLQFDNKGRGVVLIGHSQGARVLSELIAREIEGKPAQKRIVSALLLGTAVNVPKGQDVGGTFRHLPLCRSASQVGCVVSYVSFRANVPPPPNTLFGRASRADLEVACTNPAALESGSGPLQAYLPVRTSLMGEAFAKGPWTTQVQDIDADFVSVPGMLRAQCVRSGDLSYLAVSVQPMAGSPGADIAGDLVYNGRVLNEWGLHLVDVNLALGDLVALVRRQGQAHAAMK